MKRREFITSSLALTGSMGLAGLPTASAAGARARVVSYRVLGKTGMRISDISFGTGQLPAASLVLRAVDRGINYFDTAPDYGRSESYLGEALARLKARDKLYIASKYCDAVPFERGVSHLRAGSSKQQYKDAVERSLRRMGTDYLDVVFVHAMGELNDLEAERARLFDENMLNATDELKREGKARFLAVSSHGPYHMEQLMSEAVRSGHFDLIMMAFNFAKFPRIPGVLEEAQARGVGVVAMKTLAGARDMNLDPKGGVFEHAAFKWVLKHPEVGGLVVTMKRVRDLDLYLQASGKEHTASDQRLLDRYLAQFGRDYCRTGCSDCEAACPAGVPVASILRYQMYFEHYADQKRAMKAYADLGLRARDCVDCAVESCVSGCPHELPVARKLRIAHEQLSFSSAV